MKILAIDCTASPASVAICEDGKIISSVYTNVGLQHSQTLIPMLDSALKCAKIELSDIDRFAINAGPGSFTGVRIGVATVKGMAHGAGKDCIAVNRAGRPWPTGSANLTGSCAPFRTPARDRCTAPRSGRETA